MKLFFSKKNNNNSSEENHKPKMRLLFTPQIILNVSDYLFHKVIMNKQQQKEENMS